MDFLRSSMNSVVLHAAMGDHAWGHGDLQVGRAWLGQGSSVIPGHTGHL